MDKSSMKLGDRFYVEYREDVFQPQKQHKVVQTDQAHWRTQLSDGLSRVIPRSSHQQDWQVRFTSSRQHFCKCIKKIVKLPILF